MISGKVTLVRGKAATSEDWGSYDFLALPSPGDRLMVDGEGNAHYATVIAVHHTPRSSGSNDQPTIEIVAKWTGSGPKLR
ncbi:hypothetical protein GRI62_08180 [Erythrobacter arachoides]|uniref:Uncharacterized protein n=1 Tax=Aurantiacibacter arachoides TaxID=1850444 RepID=A0A844ZZH3_9SPHN|nr:hypothetical protein [Aurantiacibacter arachoides]MXO93583.1 hypothetical protein [Aurantiacibacter arachoides]GGD48278.1 hypothetical protein GCM10011411_05000 [Aurantiacibacter arachoides]